MTEAAKQLTAARLAARLQLRQLAKGIDVHPRTIARWERGETRPTAAQWSKTIAYLAQLVPQQANALAQRAGVPLVVAEPPAVDDKLIAQALLRAADLLDVSPKRVRAALRELTKATFEAGGKLEHLARAAEDAMEATA